MNKGVLCSAALATLIFAFAAATQLVPTLTLQSPSEQEFGFFGHAVAAAGDVDADSVPDLLVGAFWENPGASPARAGRTHLFAGASGSPLLTLQSPTEEASGEFGSAVAGPGDLDNDGIPDLLVGAPGESPGTSPDAAGRAHVFRGADGSLLRTLKSPNESSFAHFGAAVAASVDVDSDGVGDLLVGAPGENTSIINAGRAYAFSGADGSLVHVVESPTPLQGGEFGIALAGVSDVNGDSTPDILVGAQSEFGGSDPIAAGRAHLFSGVTGSLIRTLASPNPSFGGHFGAAVAGTPDIDGDGTADLLVGAPDEGGIPGTGNAYLFSGATGGLLLALPPLGSGQQAFGTTVGSPGDLDGDGVSDLFIGNPGGTVTAGRVHLVSGADGSVLQTLVAPDVAFQGDFGRDAAAVGDLDGDGLVDLLVGARTNTSPPVGAGRAYVFSSNAPPVADAGPDQTLECAAPSGSSVTLDGSGSSDPNGDPLTYTWREGSVVIAGPTTNATVTVVLALGVHVITLTVEDGKGASDSDEVVVTVKDTTPPTILVGALPQRFWPANHEYRNVDLAGIGLTVIDACDAAVAANDVLLTAAVSDEPENGPDDGDTLLDMLIASDCRSAMLRAERQGTGNGRVYTLALGVADASGNVGVGTYEAHIPVSVQAPVVNDGATSGYSIAGCAVP